MSMKQCSLGVLTAILFSSYSIAGTWQTIDIPNGQFETAYGIQGNNVVGRYVKNGVPNGFIYNMQSSTFNTFNKPSAEGTEVWGIDNSNLVGCFYDGVKNHGFLYNGSSWTTFDPSGSIDTVPRAISGNKIVGVYNNDYYDRGFIYDIVSSNIQTFTAFGSKTTFACDIEGNKIVGYYYDNLTHSSHGYVFDGTTYEHFDVPGAYNTYLTCISGNRMAGYFSTDSSDYPLSGFVYDGQTWTTFSSPSEGSDKRVWVYGIDGDNIVGVYKEYYSDRAFIYTIPEPASALLISAGLIFIRKKR